MKSIKYIVSTILLLGSIVSSAQWSIPEGFLSPNGDTVHVGVTYNIIKTPNNTTVYVLEISNDWISGTKAL